LLTQIRQERLVRVAVFLDLIGQPLATIGQSLYLGIESANARRKDILEEASNPLGGF
jgi:hypothetical protein